MKIFKEMGGLQLCGIQLSQFYGIELDDFSCEIARLSLWLAEHQMNVEFFNEFGRTNPTLPLKKTGNIVQGNSTRLDWEEVCPKEKKDEIYLSKSEIKEYRIAIAPKYMNIILRYIFDAHPM